ncbi:hypothetical protein ACQKWADRAFT_308502 [Trichoderma austrokoningii]
MSKHASDSHLECPSAKKKRVSDSLPNAFGPMNMEKAEMSVREKLLTGVAIGFKKTQIKKQQAAEASQSFYEVATLQDALDKEFHVNPRILQRINSPWQSGTMVIPKEEDEAAEDRNSRRDRQGDVMLDHYLRRKEQRLQAITGLANDTPFVPTGVSQALAQHGPGEGLRLFLHSACRNYGYRKLGLELLEFWHVKITHDFTSEPLGFAPMPSTMDTKLSASLGTKEGSLAMYESDVPDELGHVTTWLWLKICKPLAKNEQSKHFPAPDMSEDQEAWNIVAIPKSKVRVLQDKSSQSQAPGEMTTGSDNMWAMAPGSVFHKIRDQPKKPSKDEPKKTAVTMRYSRDGVPSMACSDKKGQAFYAWYNFRWDLRELQWDEIHDAMVRNSCLVHALSKPGVGWVAIPPERPEQSKR